MGLSLLEFEARIKDLLDQRVTKTFENDYSTPIMDAAGNVQRYGETFAFLVRVSSATNNVEVLDRTMLDNPSSMNDVTDIYGGVPLLGAPAGVLQGSLAGAGKTEDDATIELMKHNLGFAHVKNSISAGTIAQSRYKVVPVANDVLSLKNRVWADHENDFKDIPELVLKPTDIQLMARYVTSMSNMPAFSKMYNELGSVQETREKGSTLYVKKVSLTRRVLRYNPEFIAKAIVQDMLAKKIGLPGMERYGGAMASLGYMIGHEMLHVIYNHFDPTVNQGLKDMQLPPILNRSDSKMLKRVMANTVPIEELMNNRFMSAMFDMPATNGGYTVPEFRKEGERKRSSFNRIAGGRWYLGNTAVFPAMDGEGHAATAQMLMRDSDLNADSLAPVQNNLMAGAGKLAYDTWYPVTFYVAADTDGEERKRFETMPQEATFFADSTLPLPTFWDLELLMRRGLSATRTDEELVKKKPSYGDVRKPEVNATPAGPQTPPADDDTTLGDLAGQDADTNADDAGADAGGADDQQPQKVTPPMQAGDVALDKANGIYKVVIGVVEDGDPQTLMTYPVTKLSTDLANKIMRAVQGHKDGDLLDQAAIQGALASAQTGGAPYAPVRLGADALTSVVASMAANRISDETMKGDELRPVYMDVRDQVDVDPDQQGGDDEGEQEPQPDVEINNNPDMPPQDDQDQQMGGGGSGEPEDDDDNQSGGGSSDDAGDDDEESDTGDSGDGDAGDAGAEGEPSDDDDDDQSGGEPSGDAGDADPSDDNGDEQQPGGDAGDPSDDADADPDADADTDGEGTGGDAGDDQGDDADADGEGSGDSADGDDTDDTDGEGSGAGADGDDADSDDDAEGEGSGAGADGDDTDDDETDGEGSGSGADGDDQDGSDDTDGDQDGSGSAGDQDDTDDNSDGFSGSDSDDNADDQDGTGGDANDQDSSSSSSSSSDSNDPEQGGDSSDGGDSDDTSMKDRMDQMAGQDDEDGKTAEQEWDDYLDSLGNDENSSTLGSNDTSDEAEERTDSDTSGDDADGDGDADSGDDADQTGTDGDSDSDSDGDGADANGDSTDGDADDTDGDDSSGTDGDGTDPADDTDPESLMDRDPDSDEEKAERKRKQDKLKEQLDKLNDQLQEASDTMDKNREEREQNNGQLSQDSMKDQAGAGDGAGLSFGGAAKADKQTQGLLSMIRKWSRKIKGLKMTTDVGYNPSKLSRRIKGAWGADDDMPVLKGKDDKVLLVILDASGSLSQYSKLISKTIAATVYELDKKMGVKYVVPVNFDGSTYQTGVYTLKELEKELPRFLRSSHSLLLTAYEYIADLFEGKKQFEKTKFKGDPKRLTVGGVLMLSDYDLQEFWSRGYGNQRDAVIPERMMKAMKVRGAKLPWMNICWLTSGPETVQYLYKYHQLNAEKWQHKVIFDGVVVNNDGTGAPVNLPKVKRKRD